LSPNLEEVKSVIDKMILYHSVLVSDIDNEPEFGDYTYGFIHMRYCFNAYKEEIRFAGTG